MLHKYRQTGRHPGIVLVTPLVDDIIREAEGHVMACRFTVQNGRIPPYSGKKLTK